MHLGSELKKLYLYKPNIQNIINSIPSSSSYYKVSVHSLGGREAEDLMKSFAFACIAFNSSLIVYSSHTNSPHLYVAGCARNIPPASA